MKSSGFECKMCVCVCVCVCMGVGGVGGGGIAVFGGGEEEGGGTEECTSPDLEGLQAGYSDSILGNSIPVSNGPGIELEGQFPVVGSGGWDFEGVVVLMTGANLQLQSLSSFGANMQLQVLSSFGTDCKPATSDSE